MSQRVRSPYDDLWSRPREVGLPVVLGFLVTGAAWLLWLFGPPRLPRAIPSWHDLTATLTGTAVPYDFLIYVSCMAGWMLLLSLALLLVVQLLLDALEVLSGGARWLRSLRGVVDRLSPPFIRRLTHGAVATLLFVQLARSPFSAGAAPAPATITAVTTIPVPNRDAATPPAHDLPPVAAFGVRHPDAPAAPASPKEPHVAMVTVVPNDTLWTIAQRYYGSGEDYPRIVAANAGRRMVDGTVFRSGGVIRPGWVLVIPLPSTRVEAVGAHRFYVVEQGDTLWGITGRFLGDEFRYPELFALNRGAPLGDGHVLTDPNLIWPGLRLRLPDSVPATVTPDTPAVVTAPHAGAPEVAVPRGSLPTPAATHRVAAEDALAPVAPISPPDADAAIPAPAMHHPLPGTAATTADAATAATLPVASSVARTAPHGPGVSPTVLLAGAVLAGAGAVAAVAAARKGFAAQYREATRRLRAGHPSLPVVEGFAQADAARLRGQGAGGGEREPAVLAAWWLTAQLRAAGLAQVTVVTTWHHELTTRLTLRASLGQRRHVQALLRALATALDAVVRVTVTEDRDLLVEITRVPANGWRQRAAALEELTPRPVLVPVAVAGGRQLLFVDWHALGQVLVTSLPGRAAETIVAGLTGALAARLDPAALRLHTIGASRTLPPGLLALPHQDGPAIEPSDSDAVRERLDDLLDDLDRRVRAPAHRQEDAGLPDHVLLVAELADLGPDAREAVQTLAGDGARYGYRVLAGCTRHQELDGATLADFTTRLVTHTADEEESIRLLGEPCAAELGPGGDAWLRIDRRAPLAVRAFQIGEEHFAELAHVMRAAAVADPDASDGPAPGPPPAPARAMVARAGAPTPSQTAPGPAASGSGGTPDAPVTQHAPERSELDTQPGAPGRAAAPSEPVPALSTPGDSPGSGGSGTPALPAVSAVSAVAAADTLLATDAECAGEDGTEAEAPLRLVTPVLRIRCLGTFAIEVGDQMVGFAGWSRSHAKVVSLLAFLACQIRPVPRATITAALWPDDADDHTRDGRFRKTMFRMREALGTLHPDLPVQQLVRCDADDRYWLDATLVHADAREFLEAYEATKRADLSPEATVAACERALARYRGDLLAGEEARFEWVRDVCSDEPPQELFRMRQLQLFHHIATIRRDQARYQEAIACYRTMLDQAPAFGEVSQEFFACYQALGDRAGLVAARAWLESRLRAFYCDPAHPGDEVDPALCRLDATTQAVYDALLADLRDRPAVVTTSTTGTSGAGGV